MAYLRASYTSMTMSLVRSLRPLVLAGCTLTAGALRAQDPSSIDIDLRRNLEDTTNLDVFLRANGSSFDQVVSGLTFTIRWATSSPATLGPRTNTCVDGIPVSPTAQLTDPMVNGIPTGYNYRTYNAFGLTLLSDAGCPMPADEWMLITTIAVQNDTACTVFQIVNDEFTSSPGNSRDYFCSLGGLDRTGAIEPTDVQMGPCDISLGTAPAAVADVPFLISPNPTTGRIGVQIGAAVTGRVLYTVVDATGRTITSGQRSVLTKGDRFLIDLGGWPDGLYLVTFDSAQGRSVQRVVKQ